MSGKGIAVAIGVGLVVGLVANQRAIANTPNPPLVKPTKPGKPKPSGGTSPPATDTGDRNGVTGGIQATEFRAGARYAIGVIAPLGTGPDGVITAFDRASWSDVDIRSAPPINSTSEAWLGEATWSPAVGQSVTPALHFGGLIITMMRGPLT